MSAPTSFSAKAIAHWLGRPIVDVEDHHDLERRAAIHEFADKLPRHEAESKAFESYVKDKRLEAAAHHLAGMKAAHGAGDMEESRKHGMLYELHLKALGMNPNGPVPPEVLSRLGSKDRPAVYRFKAHPGDQYALMDHEEQKAEEVKKSEEGKALLKKVGDDILPIEIVECDEMGVPFVKADSEEARQTCDYTAKTTQERCKNPRSRKVGDRYLCHHHADLAAKDDHRTEKSMCKECGENSCVGC